VQKVTGRAGNFKVQILAKARYVDVNKCTGCGDCAAKCPKKVPNKYNSYLDTRKAIYLPFPQAVPRKMTIDPENCIYLERQKCAICRKVCKAEAIDFEQKDEKIELNVSAIIVAVGFDVYDPTAIIEYGYGRYANVRTAMEFERLICASGPTGGHLHRARDDKPPKTIAFIQCVGARDLRTDFPYCCSVCCMHATKEAILAREHYEDIKSYIFYTDLRAFGKGFYEYVKRGEREYGITYIRAKPGEIRELPDSLNLRIFYDDPLAGEVKQLEVEMVILCTALIPPSGITDLARVLRVELDEYGFFATPDTLSSPVETTRAGIFVAGFCQGPKDIPESVAQASGAAAKAAELVYEYSSHPSRPQAEGGEYAD
jgi:heterodisulfide reductase subunit A